MKNEKTKLVWECNNDGKEIYSSEDGWKIKREDGLTPNGNSLDNKWVLRNPRGEFVDFDAYRYDLFERNNFKETF